MHANLIKNSFAAVLLTMLCGATSILWAHDGHGFGGGGGRESSGGGGQHVSGGAVSSPGGNAASTGRSFAGGSGRGFEGRGFAGNGSRGDHVMQNYGGHAGYGGNAGYGGHSGYGYTQGGYVGHGHDGDHHGHWGHHWNGGYWDGGFWPGAYYGWGFNWFLPVLPISYATYWYSGTPYYYANDVYYTWSPSYQGYVASDPPPAAGSAPVNGNAGGVADAGQVFMYPKNGQSPDLQSADKQECQQWASAQMGQDHQGAASSVSDYRRAMIACVEGRGYSAK